MMRRLRPYWYALLGAIYAAREAWAHYRFQLQFRREMRALSPEAIARIREEAIRRWQQRQKSQS